MTNYDVKSDNSLSELNKHLSTNMFIGGQTPNAQDALTFESFNDEAPCSTKYPSVAAWFYLVHYFRQVRESWKSAPVEEKKQEKKPEKKEEKKPEKKEAKKKTSDDDVDDMFGDAPAKKEVKAEKNDVDNMFESDGEEDKDAAKARQERMKRNLEAKKQKDLKKGPKEVIIAKSLVLLDVKGWEEDTDWDALAKKIFEINLDGLVWKEEYKTPVVAFNMKKLDVGCVIEDDKVSIEDDIIEKLLGWEDVVQSVDIACFNKI
jgi:elongation factor 1-beta